MGGRKHMLSSLDQRLKRLGLDYVDIFYAHRFDPGTPLEETMGALDSAVRQGNALYVGISSYNSKRTKEAAAILRRLDTPCIIHQPSCSMINRWVEADGLLDALDAEGMGGIAFTPLAQGLLTNKHLKGIPGDSRAVAGKSLDAGTLSNANIERVRELDAIADRRGQSLTQTALAWVLRGKRVTSALIGNARLRLAASDLILSKMILAEAAWGNLEAPRATGPKLKAVAPWRALANNLMAAQRLRTVEHAV
jgi:L-glyceraldehyde 3-phosphate reductase